MNGFRLNETILIPYPLGDIHAVLDEPLGALGESRVSMKIRVREHEAAEERHETQYGAHLQGLAHGVVLHVLVVEAVCLVPLTCDR